MRNLLFVLTIFTLAACCQAECATCDVYASFENFKAVDADTVLIVEYAPGTAQSSVRDSQWIYKPAPPGDTARSALMHAFPCGSDWRIFIPSLNRHYLITDMKTEGEKCACSGGRISVVKEYALNGAVRREHFVVLP